MGEACRKLRPFGILCLGGGLVRQHRAWWAKGGSQPPMKQMFCFNSTWYGAGCWACDGEQSRPTPISVTQERLECWVGESPSWLHM